MTYQIVDDQYRTGVTTPEWWNDAEAGKTVFVADETNVHRVKDKALREYARRQGAVLHTRRDNIGGADGTVYWLTRKATT